MIKRENRDYQIAILGSLVVHLLLFLIYFPNGLKGQAMNLKTYPVGMVTLSKGPGGLVPEAPIIEPGVVGKNSPQPAILPENQPIPREPLKKVPEPPKTNLPPHTEPRTENSIATADGPSNDSPPSTTRPQTPVSSGDSEGPMGPPGDVADSSQVADSGGAGTPGPRSLGTGEGKVETGDLPFYPKNPQNERVEGEVRIGIWVFGDGRLERVEKLSSSGDSRLDNAALREVKSWKFQPESEAYYIEIVYVFDLEKNKPTVKYIKAETRPN